MARRRLPAFGVLWERHESLYAEVFSLALAELANRPAVVGEEDAISESLCPILNQVCFGMERDRKREIRVPAWERPRQPVSEEELTGGKKRKRPDFTCSCHNRAASSPDELEIPFHVECKRLGDPTSRTWILNKNYVEKGMSRFDSREHKYGKRAPSGMMIGYIISLTPPKIMGEVNTHMSEKLKGWRKLGFTWGGGFVHRHRQTIVRRHVTPARFALSHIWVDLRKNYKPT